MNPLGDKPLTPPSAITPKKARGEKSQKTKQWHEMQDSTLFRRGLNCSSPEEGYVDVIQAIKDLAVNGSKPVKALYLGIAAVFLIH